MAPTSRRTSSRSSRSRAARSVRLTSAQFARRTRQGDAHSRITTSVATGTITVGTSRVTDLAAAWETIVGADLSGTLVKGLVIDYVARPLVTGQSNYATGILRGTSLLDAADLAPATQTGDAWMSRRDHLTYGTRHMVATTPTLEFDQWRFKVRYPTFRIRGGTDSIWHCEETTGQNWEAFWSATAVLHH